MLSRLLLALTTAASTLSLNVGPGYDHPLEGQSYVLKLANVEIEIPHRFGQGFAILTACHFCASGMAALLSSHP